MAMLLILLRAYMVFLIVVILIYILRHLIFSMNRLSGIQYTHYPDIMDSDLPSVTVMVPMHNEEKVARNILDLLSVIDYPQSLFEVIPINDHSTDGTVAILDQYAAKFPYIRPLHRSSGRRGKSAALNEALIRARGDIIILFDADYLPPQGIVRSLAVCFKNPVVGAVMGRVIPENAQTNLLTKLLALERSAGYQVDQQARQNMHLIPQFGGTVGGFRKDIVRELGGFSPDSLTEDTELTFRLLINGWQVLYNNRIECYEEVPEDWDVRGRQIRRWARGHCQVMFRYMGAMLRSAYLSPVTKFDGVLLLFIYLVPLLLMVGIADAVTLFFLDQVRLLDSMFIFLAVAMFNIFGNFAPFYQVGTASFLDGFTDRIRLLPFVLFNFLFNMLYTAHGSFDAIIDILFGRTGLWQKTERFRKS
ncbi:MAG: glycosyltransferase [Elusimicrobia bacterium]|nr:glycosyltransferase [Elusimicrobiota bacterium]